MGVLEAVGCSLEFYLPVGHEDDDRVGAMMRTMHRDKGSCACHPGSYLIRSEAGCAKERLACGSGHAIAFMHEDRSH